jgi:hypothetical protein
MSEELGRDMALQAWTATRIDEVRKIAGEARAAAMEMDVPAVAAAARQFAEDMDRLADKWSARLRSVTGPDTGSPPV